VAFENEDVPAFQDEQKLLYPLVEKAVLDCLVKACKKVDGCAGLEKLEECVQALEFSQKFDCNMLPPTLKSDTAILKHIGQADASVAVSGLLVAGWKAYVESWAKPAEVLKPRAVCAFWQSFIDGDNLSLRALGKLALKEFSRPISSACCERIFSYLTHMDVSDRATMKRETMGMLLFIRGNWKLVHAW